LENGEGAVLVPGLNAVLSASGQEDCGREKHGDQERAIEILYHGGFEGSVTG
jgi:hypothetical protein